MTIGKLGFHFRFPASHACLPSEFVSRFCLAQLLGNHGKATIELVCTCEIETHRAMEGALGWFWCLPNLYLSWYTSCQSLVMSYWPGKFLTSVGQTDFCFCFSLVTVGVLSNKAWKSNETLGKGTSQWMQRQLLRASALLPLLHACGAGGLWRCLCSTYCSTYCVEACLAYVIWIALGSCNDGGWFCACLGVSAIK